jgi:hypothetical protein
VRNLFLATLILFVSSPAWAQQHTTGAPPSGNRIMQGAPLGGTPTPFSGSVGTAGPRPYVDVTAYGAKGINTDDTAAFQAAIAAACATTIGGNALVPQIYIPAGYFSIQQPQTPSTASPLNVPCSVEFIGGGGVLPQFSFAPVTMISVIAGSRPNAAPLFNVTASGVTFNHVGISGYNQGVSFKQSTDVHITHSAIDAAVTGLADNSPLVEINVFGMYADHNVFGFTTAFPNLIGNLYDVEFLGEANVAGDITYLQFFDDNSMFGACFLYDQRAAAINGQPVQFHFNNNGCEDSGGGFFTVITSTSNPAGIAGVNFSNDIVEDPQGTPKPMFNFNQLGGGASGIEVHQSAGSNSTAILQTAGTITSWSIYGCNNSCGTQAMDANGNPLGGGFEQTAGGLDFVSNISDLGRLVTRFSDPAVIQTNGIPVRLFPNGSGGFAKVGLDVSGALFSDGANNGWTGQITQSSQNSLDIGFSTTLPPTSVTGTPKHGGSLRNGTYYYFVSPEFGASGCGNKFIGAPSLLSAGATTSGGNNQVTVSWTLPPATSQALAGFCVFRTTFAGSYISQTGAYASGASTTSIIDAGSNFGTVGDFIEVNHMQAFHRFTPTSLGIGTTSPAYNLDVKGDAGVRGHIDQGATGQFAGTCTMSATTSCTITLENSYTSTPGCLVTVQSAAVVAGGCTVSGTTVTVRAAASNSSRWAAMLFGNPN